MKFFSVLLSSFLFKINLNMEQESLIIGVFKNISSVIVMSIISLKGFAMGELREKFREIITKKSTKKGKMCQK